MRGNGSEKKKLWVLSLDALGSDDAAFFEQLPSFSFMKKNGVYVPHVRSVDPTLTYPAHTSIISGRPPASHGIVNNRKLQPEREKSDWFWFETDVRGDTLFRAAKRAGRTLATFLWPVGGKSGAEINLAEIFPTQPLQNQALCSLRAGSFWSTLRFARKFGRLRKGISQPQLDNFTEACAMDAITHRDPDLLFVHFVDVDANKHFYGTHSPEAQAAIQRLDARIGRFLTYRAARPDAEQIDLVLLSDHSQMDAPHYLYPLDAFAERDWLEEENGTVPFYRAYPQSAGGSCFIYTASNFRSEEVPRLRTFLQQYAQKEEGIADLFFAPHSRFCESDPNAFAILEAKPGYCFSEFFQHREAAKGEAAVHRANHGFSPDHPNYDAVFFALGPSFLPGASLQERQSLLDIAPTLARVANLPLQGAQGHVWTALLKESLRTQRV